MDRQWVRLSDKEPEGIDRVLVLILGTPYTADVVYTNRGARFLPVYDDIVSGHPLSGRMYSLSMPEFESPVSHWMPIPDYAE